MPSIKFCVDKPGYVKMNFETLQRRTPLFDMKMYKDSASTKGLKANLTTPH
ncbi:hypothetical protein TAM4_255 [Thermococcus sp. AM4]|nr:hypothetical protein TAM4_255 [Thermococcus sp. AM4]